MFLQFHWEGRPWRTPRGRLRGVSLSAGRPLGAVPDCLTDPLDSTQRGVGAADLYFRDDTSRLLPPELAPICFLAAHPQEPHGWVLKQRLQGWAWRGGQLTPPQLPPLCPGSSLGGSRATSDVLGERMFDTRVSQQMSAIPDDQALPRQYCSPHDERTAPCVHGLGRPVWCNAESQVQILPPPLCP